MRHMAMYRCNEAWWLGCKCHHSQEIERIWCIFHYFNGYPAAKYHWVVSGTFQLFIYISSILYPYKWSIQSKHMASFHIDFFCGHTVWEKQFLSYKETTEEATRHFNECEWCNRLLYSFPVMFVRINDLIESLPQVSVWTQINQD